MAADVREALARGVQLFNDEAFFEAHEAWEDAWHETEGRSRSLLKALIQVAAALVQVSRGKHAGAATLMARARALLQKLPAEVHGLAVDELLFQLEGWTPARPRPWPTLELDASGTGQGGEAVSAVCPYCGESVELTVRDEGVAEEDYVEDCSVCCRPWNVHVTRSGGDAEVELSRDDA